MIDSVSLIVPLEEGVTTASKLGVTLLPQGKCAS